MTSGPRNSGLLSVCIAGEELRLHPERAVIWPRRCTVIVADTHFGKSSHFARHGIAVPAGAEETDRDRLTRLLAECDARRLIILGDFLHAPLVAGGTEARALEAWAERLTRDVELHVVAGNHDQDVATLRIGALRWWEAPWDEPPFRFVHDAGQSPPAASSGLFALSGHVHPVVRLRGAGKASLRIPVFWQRPDGLVLPSFGSFTGGFAVRPAEGERIHAVGPTGVVSLARP